ncbi:MAG: hypothetical protein ACJAS9_001889 [Polaribacter sp.]|jgi:hypothetical protein
MMQVDYVNNSALNIGLKGFQDAQSRVVVAAQEIASQSVRDSSSSSNVSGDSILINQKDLTTSLVDLKVAELDAKANVKVIQTASDLIGSLLDIRA